jgi:molecular chaperone GrpE
MNTQGTDKQHSEEAPEILADDDNTTNLQSDDEKMTETPEGSDIMADSEKYEALNDSFLRLRAEYDNYRKRTLREKADLIKSGSATVLTNILPVLDDFERAIQVLDKTDDITAVFEGIRLSDDKFMNYLSQQGVKIIEAKGQTFDTELFEAIATIPTPDEDMKGKVVDCVQTGYTLYDKVLRHAKVVVGA